MTDRIARGFPLSPLGIVALPTESLALHVSEDRHRQMIEECLESEGEFGIVWLADDGLKLVGCACEIDRVQGRENDGSLDVVARGTRPFRLVERQEDLPYPAGVVEFLDEQDDDVADPQTARETRELYAELVEQATDTTLAHEELEGLDAYSMAATIEFGADAKQELLELRSETARMHLLTLLLRAALKRLDLIDRAQAQARSNGKVRFG